MGIDVENLWSRWQDHYTDRGINPKRMCKDGIIDEDRYAQAKPRILFVMKEVNGWEGGDLRGWLRDAGPKYQMWHTIARWSAGLLQDFPSYDSVNNRETMNDALRRIATINLKKTSGGSQSDMSMISAYAHHDRELLIQQIDGIHPELIVACGTIEPLIWLLDLKIHPDKIYGEVPLRDERRKAWVIPWRHPARADNMTTYRELCKLAGKLTI